MNKYLEKVAQKSKGYSKEEMEALDMLFLENVFKTGLKTGLVGAGLGGATFPLLGWLLGSENTPVSLAASGASIGGLGGLAASPFFMDETLLAGKAEAFRQALKRWLGKPYERPYETPGLSTEINRKRLE